MDFDDYTMIVLLFSYVSSFMTCTVTDRQIKKRNTVLSRLGVLAVGWYNHLDDITRSRANKRLSMDILPFKAGHLKLLMSPRVPSATSTC